MTQIQLQKEHLRTRVKTKLAAFKGQQKLLADEKIRRYLINFEPYQKVKKVCFYVSTKEEVDTKEIIKTELQKKQKQIIVPKIDRYNLKLFLITSFADLKKGKFDILEPKENLAEIDKSEIDLFIVPGVVFDNRGNRIGKGKGYYDRLLQDIQAIKVGLTYDFQAQENIPFESHDQPVDYLITNKILKETKNLMWI